MDTYLEFKNVFTKSYNYELPEDRIAKYPVAQRDLSKILIYNKGVILQKQFYEMTDFFDEKDLLVFNESKVIKARIIFRKSSGARIEVFCLEPHSPQDYQQVFKAEGTCTWKCAVGNLKKWKSGYINAELDINGQAITLQAEKLSPNATEVLLRFSWDAPGVCFGDIIDAVGKIPIPPYLKRDSETSDLSNYQTVYSRVKGSVAAPTAGLHFTHEVLNRLEEKGTDKVFVNLHVGAGTFRPVNSETADAHDMHTEHFSVDAKTIEKLMSKAGHITAVGTTSVRTLESLYWFGVKASMPESDMSFLGQNEINNLPKGMAVEDALENLLNYIRRSDKDYFASSTQIFIVPPYKFKLTNKMITNFHLPQSTLLMLVSAFVGDDWKKIYDFALENKFRFLSYGDSSLLIP